MGLNGVINQPVILRATLSVPTPDINYLISGIIVNNNPVAHPDEDGLIHIWALPEAIVPDLELSTSSTNVVTNAAISNYLLMTSAQKQALVDLLD